MYKFKSSVQPNYLLTLNMNGLRGRMLRLPCSGNNRREILFVYGNHSSIESVYGLVQLLAVYGSVTVPDLPGMGGMESFYKLNERPTLDVMAGYLASFVKLRYRQRRMTVIGQGYGFLVVTRMLQKFPEIASRTDVLISLDGFAHHDDLRKNRINRIPYLIISMLFRQPILMRLGRNILLNPSLLKRFYAKKYATSHEFDHLSLVQKRAAVAMEVGLWRVNDVKTYLSNISTMWTVNNCRVRVDLPVWQLFTKGQAVIDPHTVEQRLRVIYSHYHKIEISAEPLLISGIIKPQSTAAIIPRKLRRLLQKKT